MASLSVQHSQLVEFIWSIAEHLRGPYRPPQYRKVMLPLIVLRRLDMVLEESKDDVLAEYSKLREQKFSEIAIATTLTEFVKGRHGVNFYNISPYTFHTLLNDHEGIAANLVAYINGFSENVRNIFEKFKFGTEITTLDDKNRLYNILSLFVRPEVRLHPRDVSNLEMGYVFEHLIRKFNEQANEEAGDHFTPREVITLMAHLIFTGDEDIYRPGIAKTIYDPACGTGGMLSVAEAYIHEHNPQANISLFGQDYNDESWAICCSDMLIKGENVANIALGDTLGDGKTSDMHPGKTFDYMLANPPYGVDWKDQQTYVRDEYDKLGFSGRFGAGLPRTDDGSLLFLQHMISKFRPAEDGGGSKIAIVFNGSPLFSGAAGGGESNIRRWIIENDWLDTIVALPDQLFYNTGIYTYIWIVTNRKRKERRGKVQMIDATRHYCKMKKSLGNKRNEISSDHVAEIVRLYADFVDGAVSTANGADAPKERGVSKIFPNQAFCFIKFVVERPLRWRVQVTPEGLSLFQESSYFTGLATSKKKDPAKAALDVENGKKKQKATLAALRIFDADKVYMDYAVFSGELRANLEKCKLKLTNALEKALIACFCTIDPEAASVCDADGNPLPDSNLRDTENMPLPETVSLPLPLGYGDDESNERLLKIVQPYCEMYFNREVVPHRPDAWVDWGKTKVGYEIPLTRHFYVYEPPRPLEDIEADMAGLEAEIVHEQTELFGSNV